MKQFAIILSGLVLLSAAFSWGAVINTYQNTCSPSWKTWTYSVASFGYVELNGLCVYNDEQSGAWYTYSSKLQCNMTYPPKWPANTAAHTYDDCLIIPPTFGFADAINVYRGAPDCTITPGQCSFYLNCVDRTKSCGPDGYAVSYGYHYCSEYMTQLSCFTADGQQWVKSTLLCLQNALVNIIANKSITCPGIYQEAYNSHSGCYFQPDPNHPDVSICNLYSYKDLIGIGHVIWNAFAHVNTWKQATQTMGGCIGSSVRKIYNILTDSIDFSQITSMVAKLSSVSLTNVLIVDSYYAGMSNRLVCAEPGSIGNQTSLNVTVVFNNLTASEEAKAGMLLDSGLTTIWPAASVSVCSDVNATLCSSSPAPPANITFTS
jgi:hypothetical protein